MIYSTGEIKHTDIKFFRKIVNHEIITTFFQSSSITRATVFGFQSILYGAENKIWTFWMDIDPCPFRRDSQEESSVDMCQMHNYSKTVSDDAAFAFVFSSASPISSSVIALRQRFIRSSSLPSLSVLAGTLLFINDAAFALASGTAFPFTYRVTALLRNENCNEFLPILLLERHLPLTDPHTSICISSDVVGPENSFCARFYMEQETAYGGSMESGVHTGGGGRNTRGPTANVAVILSTFVPREFVVGRENSFCARFYMEQETAYGGSMESGVHTGGGGRNTRGPTANVAVRPLPQLRINSEA
ncbi:unnamed protein product [Fraxinus pennsylvanica]|uniref:Uncharacterized protein n=1 Tax=Fraxinus pennsylvanica TaxID=56036 RepID=A0AAD1YU06_9LAMI|nr:unnamed protein product [Fraxinus pennsylvanica]